MKFIFNNKIYNPVNLEKKLKKLGITLKDIQIIEDNKIIDEIDTSIQKYYFKNTITGETIISIYPSLEHLKNIVNIYEYKRQSSRGVKKTLIG